MGYLSYFDTFWFRLLKNKNYDLTIPYLLDKHNINLDDYWILKNSNNFRLINKQDIEKYAGVICFRKDIFKKEDIDKWLLLTDKFWTGFLSRPFPPVELLNKIKIIEWDIR